MINKDLLSDTNLNSMSGPSATSHWILWVILAFIMIAILWASLAVLDEVTSGEGKVIPSSKIQVIQNLEGGIVREILVREGQIVEKNQILMHIDDTRFASSYKESVLKVDALRAKAERLRAEKDNKNFIVPDNLSVNQKKFFADELSLYKTRKQELKTKINKMNNQLEQKKHELSEIKARKQQLSGSYKLVLKELHMTKPLLRGGAVSEVEVLRLERQANDLRGEFEAAKLAVPRLESAVNEAKNSIKELEYAAITKSHDELVKVKAELAALTATTAALKDRVNRTAVRSPVRGTIKQINVATIGGVVQPGSDLMEIVPSDDTLLLEAHIRPSDIGFLRPGQNAIVKVSAYDFSIYGGLNAKVEHISADTIKNEQGDSFYKIYVRTDKNYIGLKNQKLVIIPGMLATVDVLTGKKTVLDYLLKPILKTKQRAMRER